MITVKEIIKKLSEYPQDMPVVQTMYSDYQDFDLEGSEVVSMIPTSYGAMMQHSTMPEEIKQKAIDFLMIQGN